MFKNLTVAKRLALGFGATVALGVGIVAYAALTMKVLSSDIEELATNRMVKVAQFSDIKDNFQTIGRLTRNVVINNDPAFVAQEKQKIADLRAKNTEILAKLDKTIVLPAAQEFLKIINDNRPPYYQCTELKPHPPCMQSVDEAWLGRGHEARCALG